MSMHCIGKLLAGGKQAGEVQLTGRDSQRRKRQARRLPGAAWLHRRRALRCSGPLR